MNTEKLLALIEGLEQCQFDEPKGVHTLPREETISLITRSMEGYSIVKDEDVRLMLSFAPSGAVPEGLDPTFYHTLTYAGDFELQEKINRIRCSIAAATGADK